MVHHCCVPKCSSRSNTSKGVTFHAFPKNKVLQEAWVHKIKRDTRKSLRNPVPFVVTKYTKVCSKHFEREDFIITSERHYIKPTVVPSKFYWTKEIIARKQRSSPVSSGTEAISRSSPVSSGTEAISRSSPVCSGTDAIAMNLQSAAVGNEQVLETYGICSGDKTLTDRCSGRPLEEVVTSQGDLPLEVATNRKEVVDVLMENANFKEQLISMKLELQKKNNELNVYHNILHERKLFCIEYFKEFDDKICYYTGFPNYNVFQTAFKLILPTGDAADISLGRDEPPLRHRRFKLSAENMFFLMLVKLRRAFSYEHLSYLFCVAKATLCRIFKSWINFVYLRLGSLNIWPHRNIIMENCLPEFCRKYPNVLGSIDCTELYIQTPSSLVRQSQCYSNYKSNNTLKGILVVDPNGAVIFVSQLFTGSISDKKLVVESGLVSHIQHKVAKGDIFSGDILLADKGFDIGDTMEPVKLNIPAFRSSSCKFSASDVSNTRTIAQERIHVERAIGRIKSFQILANDIPISHMSNINQIRTVCCLLTNFRHSLRKTNTLSQEND